LIPKYRAAARRLIPSISNGAADLLIKSLFHPPPRTKAGLQQDQRIFNWVLLADLPLFYSGCSPRSLFPDNTFSGISRPPRGSIFWPNPMVDAGGLESDFDLREAASARRFTWRVS
jgi:hypothetical protein